LLEWRESQARGLIIVGTEQRVVGGRSQHSCQWLRNFDPATTSFIQNTPPAKSGVPFTAIARNGTPPESCAGFSSAGILHDRTTMGPRPGIAIATLLAIYFYFVLFFFEGRVSMKRVKKIVATAFLFTPFHKVRGVEFLPVWRIKGLKVPGAGI